MATTFNQASDISCIILVKNEAKHLARCIESLRPVVRTVFVIDSGSTDQTEEIARNAGAAFLAHGWINHATQLQWALENCPVETGWTLRMDADEYLLPELAEEIVRRLPLLPHDVSGVCLRRRVIFMGRWIRHGGYYPTILLRLWRTGFGFVEQRWMDEHILLKEGRTVTFHHDFVDHNLNDLTWWTDKHNNYASREATDLLRLRRVPQQGKLHTGGQAKVRRWAKTRIYARTPPFVRPAAYFAYRYLLRLGFLDGVEGAIFHILQGFWYRFLVDAKLYELTIRSNSFGEQSTPPTDSSAATSRPSGVASPTESDTDSAHIARCGR